MTYVDPTRETFAAFRALERPGPVHMLNLLRFHAVARYDDGREVSGAEAYRAYATGSGPVLEALGGRQVWLGVPELTLIGPSTERWDLAFIAEYPSVEALVSMLKDPTYRAAVKHRQAAVADSRLIRMQPQQAGMRFGETASRPKGA